ncbi:MFS transporter [Jiangella endophytica]|uniref:MFS transporter n=1 Tax=Jiangella endophytica TaxID=1623398 RepID=UPI0018E55317|nr:MFS transporter [Jiangella endophytica]
MGLIGALGVLVCRDLRAPEWVAGILVGAFFLGGACFILTTGRAIDRFGWRRAALAGQFGTVAALLLLAGTPGPWQVLLAGIALAGVGSSITQPATSVLLTRYVEPARRGFALNVKLAAVPAALLLAGVAVPTLGEAVDWRYAFLAAVVLPVGTILLLRGFDPAPVAVPAAAPSDPRAGFRPGWRPGLSMLLGSMLPGVALAFTVPSMVAVSMTPGQAGLWFAALNVVSVGTRLGVAFLADRPRFDGVRPVVVMLLLGGLGCALIAVPTTPTVLVGALLAFGLGWGWTGQAFAVVLRFAERPGAVAGAMQSGGMAGSALGPILGAAAVHLWGLAGAWLLAGAAAVAAGFVIAGLPGPGPVPLVKEELA